MHNDLRFRLSVCLSRPNIVGLSGRHFWASCQLVTSAASFLTSVGDSATRQEGGGRGRAGPCPVWRLTFLRIASATQTPPMCRDKWRLQDSPGICDGGSGSGAGTFSSSHGHSQLELGGAARVNTVERGAVPVIAHLRASPEDVGRDRVRKWEIRGKTSSGVERASDSYGSSRKGWP